MEPLPVGTEVIYHGTWPEYHGRYIIRGHADHNKLKLHGRDDPSYIDGVGYELWPVGVEPNYRNRDESLTFVRRGSITEVNDESSE
jgi:hypothetical protein